MRKTHGRKTTRRTKKAAEHVYAVIPKKAKTPPTEFLKNPDATPLKPELTNKLNEAFHFKHRQGVHKLLNRQPHLKKQFRGIRVA